MPKLTILSIWLCNLGWHKARKGGMIEGRTVTFKINENRSRTLKYLRCQRCGRDYLGSIVIRDYRLFP